MHYVLVSIKEDHWDRVPRSYFDQDYIGETEPLFIEDLKNRTPTIFIRIPKDLDAIEKPFNNDVFRAWEGYVDNIELIKSRVYFDVIINRELFVLPIYYLRYALLGVGWYVDSDESFDIIMNENLPPFVQNLKYTSNEDEFNNLFLRFLKLLGINNIQLIESSVGIFSISNKLRVLFFTKKIENLESYILLINDKNFENKQIWIITRAKSKVISEKEGILIKEVSINDLMKIYLEWILKDSIDEDSLVSFLAQI